MPEALDNRSDVDRRIGDNGSAKAISDLLDYKGPPDGFLGDLLALQCRQAGGVAAALLRLGDEDRCEILAVHPRLETNGTDLAWLSEIEKPFQKVIKRGKSTILKDAAEPANGGEHQHYILVLPIHSSTTVRAAVAFRVRAQTRGQLLLSNARLEATTLLLNHHDLRLNMKRHQATSRRLRQALEVLEKINRSSCCKGAAMALCNELATRLGCRRVSIGFTRKRAIKIRAMSHSDTFSHRMQSVQAIEAAMEECLDQDMEILHPAEDRTIYANRAAAKLAEQNGNSAVLSLPMRIGGQAKGVLALERSEAKPFDRLEVIEDIRLICDLCSPRLFDLDQNDRWVGARLAEEVRQRLESMGGPRHAGIKLGFGFAFLVLLMLAILKGDYRVKTTFSLETRHQQIVVAPFDTYSQSIKVEPGDRVLGGETLLGTLETSELRLKLAALKAEQLGYQKEMTAAMRDRKTAETQIAVANSDKLAAEIRLAEKKIEQAVLIAPITGWVVSKDLTQKIGAPVETGAVLFESADIDSLRAELYVPESAITDIAIGQLGRLAAAGHPGKKIDFIIERINPIAEVIDHQNVFRVRARLNEHPEWMRPGMEGEARINAGQKSYLWLATHRLVDWLRMKFWI